MAKSSSKKKNVTVYLIPEGETRDSHTYHYTAVKTKTLTSISGGDYNHLTPAADGSINLLKTDIYDVSLIQDIRGGFNTDISDRYIIDNGSRDNFYDVGKLILKDLIL